jgi:hypothetical protein
MFIFIQVQDKTRDFEQGKTISHLNWGGKKGEVVKVKNFDH